MKIKWLLIILIVVVFSGGRVAMAKVGHQHPSQGSTEQNMEGMDMSGDHNMDGMDMSGDKNSESHDMEGMDMSGKNSDSHDMEGMDMSGKNSDSHDMEGMDMSGDHSKVSHDDMEGMHMEHEPVVEKPANLKVLGTFGAVNLSFIVIGIWSKWFRRKGDLNGNSK